MVRDLSTDLGTFDGDFQERNHLPPKLRDVSKMTVEFDYIYILDIYVTADSQYQNPNCGSVTDGF
jgi:hypothetical protein